MAIVRELFCALRFQNEHLRHMSFGDSAMVDSELEGTLRFLMDPAPAWEPER
ncbi:hypothetical protein D3C78_1994720 [compost metagenome]